MSEPTCGSCQHWRKLPADPHNLGAAAQGQCRERLHCIGLMSPQGPAGLPVYLAVPADFPRCSQYRPVLKLNGAGSKSGLEGL